MRMKKAAVIALACALSAGSAFASFAGWVESGSDWRYQNEDQSWKAGQWFQDKDGTWYSFDQAGNVRKGWFQDTNGKWYFFSYEGKMQTGLISVDNKVYFMNNSGDLFEGEKAVGNAKYNFGLYGTTNGTPAVAAARKFGSNGNHSTGYSTGGGGGSSSGGGGGSSHSPSPSTPTVSETEKKVEATNKAVSQATADLQGKTGIDDAQFEASSNTLTVTLDAATSSSTDAADFSAAIGSVAKAAINQADANSAVDISLPSGTDVAGQKVSGSQIQITAPANRAGTKSVDAWISQYLAGKKLDDLAGSTTITVIMGGQDVTYTIEGN